MKASEQIITREIHCKINSKLHQKCHTALLDKWTDQCGAPEADDADETGASGGDTANRMLASSKRRASRNARNAATLRRRMATKQRRRLMVHQRKQVI
jgi:hypothetical protein